MTVTGTPGTGTITLGSAVSGYLTFALAGAITGDVVYYGIKDGAGSEVGIGTYTASGTTLSRDLVFNSTNSGSKISLSGAAEVFITPPASAWREILTAPRTYYVRTDGSDSNNGLANTSGGAFLTIQKAIDVVAALDVSIYDVTISVGAGTYTAALTLKDPVGSGKVTISGAGATTIVSTTSASAFDYSNSYKYTLSNMKVQTTTSGDCLTSGNGGFLTISSGFEFGAAAVYHVSGNFGGFVYLTANYTISGGGFAHWYTDNGGKILAAGITITLTGTPAFSSAFAYATNLSLQRVNANTYSGSATGTRYSALANSVIYTNGGTLPGNATGSTASGGQYL